MIGYLEGNVLSSNDKSLILLVGGVGYLIHATQETITFSLHEEPARLWIHHAVRENAVELFGFRTRDELSFFEMLIDISGIGPRGALNIVALGSLESLTSAIASGDVGYLTKVSGIGKKTAEKIVLELKDKLLKRGYSAGTSNSNDSDVLHALIALGYREGEIRDVLKSLPPESTDTNSKIKSALKMLGRN